MTGRLPSAVHLAVPEGSHRPAIDYPPTRVDVFRASRFDLGRLEMTLERGEQFWITDRERTVVDAFRLRHLIGEDLAHDALRRYLRSRPKPARVAELARVLAGLAPRGRRHPDPLGMNRPSRDTTAGRVYFDLRATARRIGRPTDELFVLYVLAVGDAVQQVVDPVNELVLSWR